jgi:hypothetical protein
VSRTVCGVDHLGFAVMFLSESKIVHVLLSKFWGYVYFISHGAGKLLTCFGTIQV